MITIGISLLWPWELIGFSSFPNTRIWDFCFSIGPRFVANPQWADLNHFYGWISDISLILRWTIGFWKCCSGPLRLIWIDCSLDRKPFVDSKPIVGWYWNHSEPEQNSESLFSEYLWIRGKFKMLFWFRSENKKSETFLKTAEKHKGKLSNGYWTVLIRYWIKIEIKILLKWNILILLSLIILPWAISTSRWKLLNVFLCFATSSKLRWYRFLSKHTNRHKVNGKKGNYTLPSSWRLVMVRKRLWTQITHRNTLAYSFRYCMTL